ncbi:MAG: pyruvate/2-oxoglutarate dehydrogenase complex dihydrolipoamide dehydrogenase (E3) component [Ilumatobacter sp.]|jgi:pyruvate/2-oxoglutarate dehydrogenase complex dihydrolipoamide dehydrogenase (E3) component
MSNHDPRFDPTRTYKAAVIGAGSGGLTMAIGLAGFGHDVALIEGGKIGGDCTNVGCIPSKALLHAAHTDHEDPFQYVRDKRDDLEEREDEEMVEHEQIHLVRGWAKLTKQRDPHVVEVTANDGSTIEVRAENVIVCAGSQPIEFPIEGLDPERLLTNENVFELRSTPAKVVLIGGGAISLEMATAFRDLGSNVEIVELQDRLIANEDPLVSSTIHAALEKRAVVIHTGTSIERFDGTTAHLGNGNMITDVDKVVLAVGRQPRFGHMNLKEAGVETGKRGVVADTWGRTSVDGIWAVGDITGNTLTTHGANAIARRTIRAIALPFLPKTGNPRTMVNAVYSRPEIASVGMSYAEVQALPKSGRRRYEVQISDVDRGYTDDLEHGVAIVDVERFTGKILRAVIVCPAAGEIIGMYTMAIDQGIGMRKIFAMVHPYPAYAQLVGKIADNFARDTYPVIHKEWLAMVRGRITKRLQRS